LRFLVLSNNESRAESGGKVFLFIKIPSIYCKDSERKLNPLLDSHKLPFPLIWENSFLLRIPLSFVSIFGAKEPCVSLHSNYSEELEQSRESSRDFPRYSDRISEPVRTSSRVSGSSFHSNLASSLFVFTENSRLPDILLFCISFALSHLFLLYSFLLPFFL